MNTYCVYKQHRSYGNTTQGLNAEVVEMLRKNLFSQPKSLNIDNIRTLRVDW